MPLYTPRIIEPPPSVWSEVGRQALSVGQALMQHRAMQEERERQRQLDAEREQDRFFRMVTTPGVEPISSVEPSHGIQRQSVLPPPALPPKDDSVPAPVRTGTPTPTIEQARLPGQDAALRVPEGRIRLGENLMYNPRWEEEQQARLAEQRLRQEREEEERRIGRLIAGLEPVHGERASGMAQALVAGAPISALGPQAPVRGTPEYFDTLRKELQIEAAFRPPPEEPRLTPLQERNARMDAARASAMTIAENLDRPADPSRFSGAPPTGVARMNATQMAQVLRSQHPDLSEQELLQVANEALQEVQRQRQRSGGGGAYFELPDGRVISLDSLRTGGGQAPTPQAPSETKSLEQRAAELKAQGKTLEEARAILMAEGYRW